MAHSPTNIEFKLVGARTHNLKNLNINIPKNSFVVVTGPSGSGKSSLTVNTIHAESQHRYLEHLSGYSRASLNLKQRGELDTLVNLSPTICLESKNIYSNPRSTVGTTSGIFHHIRQIFSSYGTFYSPKSGKELKRHNAFQIKNSIIEKIKQKLKSDKWLLTVPVSGNTKKDLWKGLQKYKSKGYVRFIFENQIYSLEKIKPDELNLQGPVLIVIDRLKLDSNNLTKKLPRLAESIELSLIEGEGNLIFINQEEKLSCAFSQNYWDQENNITYASLDYKDFSFNSSIGACESCQGLGFISESKSDTEEDARECEVCSGSRFSNQVLTSKVNKLNIAQVCDLSLLDLKKWLNDLPQFTDSTNKKSLEILIKELFPKLDAVLELGLGYLNLNRVVSSLSNGEAQRIRLANGIRGELSGLLYIVDEPSRGLHYRDVNNLCKVFRKLITNGNSVMIAEHHPEIINQADFLIELGPKGGDQGGNLIYAGKLKHPSTSPTLTHLNNFLPAKLNSKVSIKKFISVDYNPMNNLKKNSVKFPFGKLTFITGVSGSGKSTLLSIFYSLFKHPKKFSKLGATKGFNFKNVYMVDSKPLGKSSRSNSATYTGTFSIIREIFAKTKQSKIKGYSAGRFSFNNKAGRCDFCSGEGSVSISLPYQFDSSVICEQCKGTGYNEETLRITLKGKNISEVLDLSIAEAYDYFKNHPKLEIVLGTLKKVGLEYLQLGQSGNTLSGGELQRIKLATFLAKGAAEPSLFLLDEPTAGLHFSDIQNISKIFKDMIKTGHTLVMIEHNLEIINQGDWILDLGPEPGNLGGNVTFSGSPAELSQHINSPTAKVYQKFLKN